MSQSPLTPAINGTGVILHTGLGRAVLPKAAQQSILEMITGYCTLEIEAASGKRGSRHDIVREALCALTGAESALVVNNNAAAVMLILRTLAQDREVIVSRGQLVEIGGSFRMPDVMAQSGAELISVGATNETRLDDFRDAITDRTALMMAIHRSNFEIVGEDTEVLLEDLIALGREMQIPVVHDLGSGVLVDLSAYGLQKEPTVPESIAAGAQIVCFSGDKLLGGPQAGLIVGDTAFLNQMKTNPLMRALRVDKMTLAALAATLELFYDEHSLQTTHPVIQMLAESAQSLDLKAGELAGRLQGIFDHTIDVTVEDAMSEIGGGALPSQQIPTRVIALTPQQGSNHDIASLFRQHHPPVFGRLHRAQFLLDMRTIQQEDTPAILAGAQFVMDAITSIS